MKAIVMPVVGVVSCLTIGSCALWPLPQILALTKRTPEAAVKTSNASVPIERRSSESAARGSSKTATERETDRTVDPRSEQVLRRKVELLAAGLKFLKSKPCYTTTMQKREVVKGELLEEQTIELKCRQHPFSVYLHWLTGDKGREVIFVEGQNNGNMIAHDGGWKARIPAFSLPVDCKLAMLDTRYPVSAAGIGDLIETMTKIHQDDLEKGNFLSSQSTTGEEFNGRPCEIFTTIYKSAAQSPTYRKSITYIDTGWSIPIHSTHFEWPHSHSKLPDSELDDATLLEKYSFNDINFNVQLDDRDFDSKNANYHFR